jgi:hypothetical protein
LGEEPTKDYLLNALMDGKIGHFWIVHSFPVNDAWIYMSFGQTWMHSGIKKNRSDSYAIEP